MLKIVIFVVLIKVLGVSLKKVLVVATWGCPAQWGDASYVLGEDLVRRLIGSRGSSDLYRVSCTSLSILVDALKGVGLDYRVALVILDSLVDRYRGRPTGSKCFECYENAFSGLSGFEGFGSYRDLLKFVEGLSRDVIRCLLGDSDRVSIVVAPAIGSPGGEWVFRGGARDFAAVSMMKLYGIAESYVPDLLIVDTTHGVNYMPTEIAYVSRLLLSALLPRKLLDNGGSRYLELLVVNSDPYPPSARQPELSLNVVYRERVKAVHRLDAVPKVIAKPRPIENRSVEKGVLERVKELNRRYEKYAHIYLATSAPLPLALCATCSEVSDENLLGEVYELWIDSAVIEGKSVYRLVRLVPEAVYAYIVAKEFCRFVTEKEAKGSEVGLEHFGSLAKLYGLVDEAYEILVNDEVKRIEQALREKALDVDEWVKLCEVYGECRTVPKPDKRTMIAHGGLQKEFVEVNPRKKMVRYVKSLNIDEVLEEIVSSLEEPIL